MESYVVEPQSLFVPYLSDVLARAQMHVVRVAARLDAADIAAVRPDALFLDMDFLDCDPVDALHAMRELLPEALICAYTDAVTGGPERFRRAGANCVLSKRSSPSEVTDGLRAARRGGSYVDPRVAGTVPTVREEFDARQLDELGG